MSSRCSLLTSFFLFQIQNNILVSFFVLFLLPKGKKKENAFLFLQNFDVSITKKNQ